MNTMVALVGKQQIPNLLPAYFLEPQEVLLVYSQFTEPEFCQLKVLLEENQMHVCGLKCGNEYETTSITQELREKLTSLHFHGDVGFNVTGGTKAMVLSAYECARELSGQVIYLESGRGKSFLYQYQFDNDDNRLMLSKECEIPPLLTIDRFLDAHLGKGAWRETGYSKDAGGVFEQVVGEILRHEVDEIKAGVRFLGNEYGKREQADLDLVIRVKNQFGVIEIKDQNRPTLDALKQLHYLSNLLGTYTKKFWVLSRQASSDHQTVIHATRTIVVELPNFVNNILPQESAQHLKTQVSQAFA